VAVLGSTPGIIVGVGVGGAVAAALEPAFEIPKQEAWKRNPNRILDSGLIARLVAQGGIDLGDPSSPAAGSAYEEALRDGLEPDKLDALIYLAQTVPGFGEAVRVLRRDPTFAGLFKHSLVKQGLDTRYLDGLTDLQFERMALPVVALGIVRGLIDAPFELPYTPPAGVGKIAAFPKSKLDPLHEIKAFGFDVDDLFLQTAVSGRPMGPQEAASAFYRDIIEKDDFLRAILEGDTRGEWADAILEHARQIPSVSDYVNAEIRGWITTAQRNAGIAKHGMTAADGDLLFKRTGRPATGHQVHIGWARGGRNTSAGSDEQTVFNKAIRESDIRPEWTDILWAQRYTYPPFFALRALMQGGALTAAQGEEILLYEGWEPGFAKLVAEFFTKDTSAAKGNPYVVKAQSQLWTAAHKAFVKDGTARATIEPVLSTLVADLADRDAIFQLWTDERALDAGQAPQTLG
jgi:hypothetical protein